MSASDNNNNNNNDKKKNDDESVREIREPKSWRSNEQQQRREETCIDCTRCGSQVPRANAVLHEAHCARRPLQNAEKKESERKESECACLDCGRMVQLAEISYHEEHECGVVGVQDKLACCHCELILDANEHAQHELECGSRTEFCERCARYVLVRHLQRHVATRCHFPLERGGSTATLGDFLPPVLQAADNESLSSSPFVSARASLATSSASSVARSIHMMESLQSELDASAELIPCEHCDELVALDDYMEHSTHCFEEQSDHGRALQFYQTSMI
jgi:TRAFD1/XAF1, zinc finger